MSKQSIQNAGLSLLNLASSIGGHIKQEKQDYLAKKIAGKFNDPTKLFFNKDGSARDPYSVASDFQQGMFSFMSIGRSDLAENLGNFYKVGTQALNTREQNKLNAQTIKVLNPEALETIRGANLDRTEIPNSLAKAPQQSFIRYESKPYTDESGNWVFKEIYYDKKSGEVMKETILPYANPFHRTSESSSTNYNRNVSSITTFNANPSIGTVTDKKGNVIGNATQLPNGKIRYNGKDWDASELSNQGLIFTGTDVNPNEVKPEGTQGTGSDAIYNELTRWTSGEDAKVLMAQLLRGDYSSNSAFFNSLPKEAMENLMRLVARFNNGSSSYNQYQNFPE